MTSVRKMRGEDYLRDMEDSLRTLHKLLGMDPAQPDTEALIVKVRALTSAPTPGRATPGERDALRALVARWRTRMPANAPDNARILMREHCADELEAALTQPIASSEAAHGEREAVAIKLWHRFGSSSVETWEEETHKAEYRDAAADVLALTQPIASSEAAHGEEDAFEEWFADIWAGSDGIPVPEWQREGWDEYIAQHQLALGAWNAAKARQPAAAPGAVDDETVERIAELIAAEMPSETVIHRCVAIAVNKAVLATKPDGPRMGGEESNG